jgi:hypothetical protein
MDVFVFRPARAGPPVTESKSLSSSAGHSPRPKNKKPGGNSIPPGFSQNTDLKTLLLRLLLLIFLRQIRLRWISRDRRTGLLIPRQERHERRNFKGHLLPRRKQSHGL